LRILCPITSARSIWTPGFALAYAAVATDYYNMQEFNLASKFYQKAFELSGRVSAKERLILQAHYYNGLCSRIWERPRFCGDFEIL